MGKVQHFYAQRKKSESGQTGSVTYDLPESGFIPEIVLTAFSTPTASTDPALPLNKAITKVEIVDGARVIQSLSANQLLGAYMHRKTRTHASSEVNDNAVEGHESIPIVLGKMVNGREYAPDFSRFSNPQIKITWDYSLTTGPFGATFDADASPVMKFTVMCKIVRDATKYTHGYVKSSVTKTFTQATSTETRIDIPRGEQLLGIMIEAGYDDLDWTEDVEQLKLDFDNGAWIPLDLFEEEIQNLELDWFGPAVVSFNMDLVDAVEIDTHMGFVTQVTGVTAATTARNFQYADSHKGVEAVAMFTETTGGASASFVATATYEQIRIEATGFMPYQCLYIPMSELLDGDGDLIDTTRYRDIVLTLTSGSSASTSSTPSVISEFLVTQ